MGDFCMPEGNPCPPICYTPQPSNYSTTEVVCDVGMNGNCWKENYCMPECYVCPRACNIPAPSVCGSPSDVWCDSGIDSNGCWMFVFCLPEGNPCPPICYPHQPSNCSTTEVLCDMGMNVNGWMGDFCMFFWLCVSTNRLKSVIITATYKKLWNVLD